MQEGMNKNVDLEKIKKIRSETGCGYVEIKNALHEANGDPEEAKKILKEQFTKKIGQTKPKLPNGYKRDWKISDIRIPNSVKSVIGFILFFGVLFLATEFFDKSYSAPESLPLPVHMTNTGRLHKLQVKCAIVVSDSIKKSGNEIPSLGLGAGSSALGLIRPVGEMFSGFLLIAGKSFFRNVVVYSDKRKAKGSEVIIELKEWTFGEKTGYNFKGLPILFAWGKAYATLNIEVEVSGPNIVPYKLNKSALETLNVNFSLFPISRLKKTMTETTDLAAASVSFIIMERIAKDYQSRSKKNKK